MSPSPADYEDVVRRILARLAEKSTAGSRKCVICGVNAWAVGKFVTLQVSNQVPTLPNPYGFRLQPPTYPMVAIFCSNCGNTQLVNLLLLGFREDELHSLQFPPDAPGG